MAPSRLSYFASLGASTDGAMFASLSYLAMDTVLDWDSFGDCSWPVHKWLLVSYAWVAACRAAELLGTRRTARGVSFLMDLRQRDEVGRALLLFSWLVGLPLFTLWTVLGSVIVADVAWHAPTSCLPPSTTAWFLVFWQVLSYVWIATHCLLGGAALVLEQRLRKLEAQLRAVEDPAAVARWGEVARLADYSALPGLADEGLTPEEIGELPGRNASAADCGECAVCIGEIEPGESVRSLGGCGHTYHRACIDLWLVRRPECPLCKGCARKKTAEPSTPASPWISV